MHWLCIMVPARIMITEPRSNESPLDCPTFSEMPGKSRFVTAPRYCAKPRPASSFVNLSHGDIRRIVTVHQDLVLLEILGSALETEFPNAVLEGAVSIQELRNKLTHEPADLLVVSASLPGEDAFSALAALKQTYSQQRMLFVTTRCDYLIVQTLRSLGARGAIDTTTDDIDCFRQALRRVAAGQTYWSANLQPMLRGSSPSIAILRHLTPMEMYLFAILGDGCSDGVAASMVDLSEQSVHSYRKRLHRKLGIQHKGDLVTRAFQYGLVRATPDGVERPGLELLRARCPASRRKNAKPLARDSMAKSVSPRASLV